MPQSNRRLFEHGSDIKCHSQDSGSQPGQFCPPEGMWQSPETFFVVKTGEGVAGIQWVKPRDAAKPLQCKGQPPWQRSTQPKTSGMLMLRNPGSGRQSGSSCQDVTEGKGWKQRAQRRCSFREIRVRPDPGWWGSSGGELGRVGRAMNRKCTNPPIISNEKEKRKMQFVIPLTGSFLQNVEKLSLTFKTFFF